MLHNPAILFTGPGSVILEEREMPVPGEGEVVLRTRRSLISTGTELTVLSGDFSPESRWNRYAAYPFSPGYSAVGEVVEVGSRVDDAWLGRHVAAWAPHARFSAVPLHDVRTVPPFDLSDEELTFFALAETVLNGIRRSDVRLGESAAVFGLGILGQLAVRFLQIAGARPLLAVDPAEPRRALVPHRPGLQTLDPAVADPIAAARELTHGRMVDVAFEVTGLGPLIASELKVVCAGGRFVILSTPRGSPTSLDFCDVNELSTSIIGAHVDSHPPPGSTFEQWTHTRHAELFFELVHVGALVVSDLITDRPRYSDAPAIYARLLEDRSRSLATIFSWDD
jgi:2-desacetyl-2-hydroxyethyl bacteriochlorophyllide A dehydrogenase